MRRWITLVLLAVLLAALGLLARHRVGLLSSRPSTTEGRYSSEERWLVGEISQDIAEMALYAAGRDPRSLRFAIDGLDRSGEPARVSLAWDGGQPLSHQLTIRRFVWSPEDYGDYALAVLAGLDLRASPGSPPDDESLLTALLNPQARVIETQNQRVTELLSRSMLDPVAHEQAALVIGALALREAAGLFADSRQLLNRMTAHLALARALRGLEAPGPSGRYAEAILLTEAGRCREAVDALEHMRESAGSSDTQRRWITSLTLRNTGDWRTLRLPRQASLLERLEYFRELAAGLNTAAAAQFHEDHEAEPVTDWGRIAMAQGVSASSAGGSFTYGAVELELDEAAGVWERIHSKRPSADELTAALNQPAERCVTLGGPRPLAWGTWAAFLQRHLCNQILAADNYVRYVEGGKDAADAGFAKADTEFRQLAQYSVVRIERANRAQKTIESIRDALDAAIGTLVRTPELVNLDGWIRVGFASRYAPLWKGAPDENVWFATDPRFMTSYESIGSRRHLTRAKQDIAALEALRAVNPFNNRLKYRIVELRHGKDPSLQQLEEEFAEESEFNLGVLYDMAWAAAADPPRRRALLERACALWNDSCIDLGDQLVQDALDLEAAKAYEKAVEKARNRVWVSDSSQWLMHHYYDKRRFDRAQTIARMAADVYSWGGLLTMGQFLEREGQLDEAEEYYKRVSDGYKDDSVLLGFYYRRVRIHEDASYESRLTTLLGKVFPKGLEKLDPVRPSGPPKEGVEIRKTGARARRWGLDRGAIIVGVDDWRVRTREQYEAVREFAFPPAVKLFAWHRGRYLEIDARLPGRRLDAELVTLGSRP